jgi:hypothetical protein
MQRNEKENLDVEIYYASEIDDDHDALHSRLIVKHHPRQ